MRPLSLVATLALFLVGSASVVACSADTSSPSDEPATNAETASGEDEEIKAASISEKDNNKTVDVQLGRSFTIALESNASTGYRWHVKSVDRTIGQPKESMIAGNPNRPGAPGTQKFTWATKSPLNLVGKHVITLEYQRPWAETQPPAKTFKVTVNIVDKIGAQKCGGLIGTTCGAGSYCEFGATEACGFADQRGTCQKKPEACAEIFQPVCGCDGKDYGNPCEANAAGTSVAKNGECHAAGTRCGNGTCGAGMVCCNPLMAICTLPGQFCIQ